LTAPRRGNESNLTTAERKESHPRGNNYEQNEVRTN
jgi:hypothetical protein